MVQNKGGYLALNAIQGSTYEVLRAQYVNGVGPSCSFSAPVMLPSLTIAGNTAATQSWVTSRNYLTAVPSAVSCNSITISAPITCNSPAAPTSFSQIG